MSLSEAKVEANRRSAKKSTGPKTQEGKALVRFNAVKHGILASEAVIRAGEGAEDVEAFANILQGLKEDFRAPKHSRRTPAGEGGRHHVAVAQGATV